MSVGTYDPIEKLAKMEWISIKAPTRQKNLYELFTLQLSGLIRNKFFTPLFQKLSQKQITVLENEKKFCNDFWNPTAPIHPEIPYHEAIRNHFNCKLENIEVDIEGTKVTVTCLVIESKKEEFQNQMDDCYNFIHLVGNLSTIDNEIMGTYPYLASYMEHLEEARDKTPPARFIIMSQYNTTYNDEQKTVYKPDSIHRAGFISAEVIKTIQNRYGTINQVVGHSLGCIVLASSLNYLQQGCDPLPKNILFDRGPSSIYQLSQRILGKTFYVASLFFSLRAVQNWLPNLGQQINSFIDGLTRSQKKIPEIVVAGSPKDHLFPKESNLCLSPFIQDLYKKKQITLLAFSPPNQCIPKSLIHMAGNHLFTKNHLTKDLKDQNFLEKETLAKTIIRKSLPSTEEANSS